MVDQKIVNAGAAKMTLPDLVEEVRTTKQPVVLAKYNKPQAALVPLEMLEFATAKTKQNGKKSA